MLKDYTLSEETTEEKIKVLSTPLKEFNMTGTATISFWCDGSGSVDMELAIFKSDRLDKDVIFQNLNDGGFGCEKIISANVVVNQIVKLEILNLETNEISFEFKEVKIFEGYISEPKSIVAKKVA